MPRALALIALLVALALGGLWWASRPGARAETSAPDVVKVEGESTNSAELEAAPVDSVVPTDVEAGRVEIAAEAGAAPTELVVHVVSADSGEPVAGVRVSVEAEGAGRDSIVALADAPATGGAGTARFHVPAERELEVRVSHDSLGAYAERDEIPPLAPSERREITIELETAADFVFHGRLVARDDGAPVADGLIVRRHDSGGSPSTGVLDGAAGEVRSAADGSFQLAGATWQRAHVQVRAEGWSTVLVKLGPGHERREDPLVLRLRRSAAVHARVLGPDGVAVHDVGVVLRTEAYNLNYQETVFDYFGGHLPLWKAAVEDDGVARLEDVPSEVPMQVFVSGSRLPFQWEEPLVLEPGEVRELELRLDSGRRIAGRMTDQFGTPITHLAVWLMPAEGGPGPPFQSFQNPFTETEAEDDGSFVFEGVPAGKWYVSPAPKRRWSVEFEEGSLADGWVEVELGTELDVTDVELVLARGLAIRGTVVGPDGNPWNGGSVHASHAGTSFWANTQIGEDGAFTLGPLPLGTQSLRAQGSGPLVANSESLDVEAGADGVVLTLRAAGGFRGEVVVPEGESIEDARILVHADELSMTEIGWGWRSTGLRTPDFEQTGLLPGTWSVTVRTRSGAIGTARRVLVRPGEITEGVRVELGEAARVRVKIAAGDEEHSHGRFEAWSDGSPCLSAGLALGGSTVRTVPPGEITIKAWIGRREVGEKTVHIAAGEEREVVFE